MAELAAAVGEALAAGGPFVVVTGRRHQGIEPLLEAATAHVVAPGPSTRLRVAQGVMLAGRQAVVMLDEPGRPAGGDTPLAVTTDPACAQVALDNGWTVVQPFAGVDVARLLEIAGGARLVLLHDEDTAVPLDAPRTGSRRQWVNGDLATLAASGASVGVAAALVPRLQERGADVSLVEIAVLEDARHRALAGGRTLLVCPADAADALRRGRWPAARMEPVPIDNEDETELIGAVLARVPAGR